jgi:putative transposon-encoded protein
MSKIEPITIEIEEKLNVRPRDIYNATVVKSGNGAVIKSFKKFLGKEVIVIIADKVKLKKKTKEERGLEFDTLMENAGEEGWGYP